MTKPARKHDLPTFIRRIGHKLADISIKLIAWPYFLLYERETRAPLMSIFATDDDDEIAQLMEQWFFTKAKEANYAQIAAAVVFASIIQGFSWDQMSSTHWIVPASWYLSILFSLFSVILGAQQTVLIDMRRKSHDNLLGPRQKLCPTVNFGSKDERHPKWALVLAWQGPLMFLSYSLVMFLVGLTAYVITPVARKGVWDDDAKILLMYSVGATVILGSFMAFSRMVHYTLA